MWYVFGFWTVFSLTEISFYKISFPYIFTVSLADRLGCWREQNLRHMIGYFQTLTTDKWSKNYLKIMVHMLRAEKRTA